MTHYALKYKQEPIPRPYSGTRRTVNTAKMLTSDKAGSNALEAPMKPQMN